MKLPVALASIILTGCCFADAENKDVNNIKNKERETETIESILAKKNLIQGEVAKRIRTYNIDTWNRLDSYHIFIEGKGKKNDYLIKFQNKCYNTRSGSTLIYKTRNNELTKFDSIGVLDSFISSHDILSPTRHCSIKEIYHLNKLDNETNTKTGKGKEKKETKK